MITKIRNLNINFTSNHLNANLKYNTCILFQFKAINHTAILFQRIIYY